MQIKRNICLTILLSFLLIWFIPLFCFQSFAGTSSSSYSNMQVPQSSSSTSTNSSSSTAEGSDSFNTDKIKSMQVKNDYIPLKIQILINKGIKAIISLSALVLVVLLAMLAFNAKDEKALSYVLKSLNIWFGTVIVLGTFSLIIKTIIWFANTMGGN